MTLTSADLWEVAEASSCAECVRDDWSTPFMVGTVTYPECPDEIRAAHLYNEWRQLCDDAACEGVFPDGMFGGISDGQVWVYSHHAECPARDRATAQFGEDGLRDAVTRMVRGRNLCQWGDWDDDRFVLGPRFCGDNRDRPATLLDLMNGREVRSLAKLPREVLAVVAAEQLCSDLDLHLDEMKEAGASAVTLATITHDIRRAKATLDEARIALHQTSRF